MNRKMKKTIKDRLNIPFEKEILIIEESLTNHSLFTLSERNKVKVGKLYLCWVKPSDRWSENKENIDDWVKYSSFKNVFLLIKLKKDLIVTINCDYPLYVLFFPISLKTVTINLFSYDINYSISHSYYTFFDDFLIKKIKEGIKISRRKLIKNLEDNIKKIKDVFK